MKPNANHSTSVNSKGGATPYPSIKHWPKADQPRERLRRSGPEPLSDTELLAVFLGTGAAGLSALELGRSLLAHCGSIRATLALDCASFCQIQGMGPARWAQLAAATELTRRSLREQLSESNALSCLAAVREFLALWLRDRPYECFSCLFLDSRHRLIEARELFRGTLTQTAVYPREIARQALQLNAAAVILSHNHPSGVAEASVADRALTDAVKLALRSLDVPVLDHLIVAGNHCLSFAERGWL